MAPPPEMLDIMIVSLGSTSGLRAVDEELLASLRRAGATTEIVRAEAPPAVRTLMLTDLSWARATRRAVQDELTRKPARILIYSTTTAALLWPRPGAIRFDAPAAGNRPGRHGLWQRPLERRRLREAPLLLPQSAGALDELGGPGAVHADALVLPVPVEPSGVHDPPGGHVHGPPVSVHDRPGGHVHGPPVSVHDRPGGHVHDRPMSVSAVEGLQVRAPVRDIAAITYAANPSKKGLDRILQAWGNARRPGEELVVAGVSESELRKLGYALPAGGVRVSPMLSSEDYRALLRRARVFVCAARREDYGIAQLEALVDGCMLVTRPSPGPYVALPIARELDERLVGEDLATALRVALDDPAPNYAERALRALEPFRRAEVDRLVAEELLPRLEARG